ncbi:hypothetical protein MBR_03794, partial [Metarhizium brunneum ARSEF 3297]
MRISKPNSTNNSPRSSSTMSNRRRTMMGGDVWTGRKQQPMLDYLSIPQHQHIDSTPSRKEPTRPLSWHPSSYHVQIPQQPVFLQQTQHQQQQHHHHQLAGLPFPTPNMYGVDSNDFYGSQAQFSPMMTSYSNDTSPSSTFSPLPLFSEAENTQFAQSDGWDACQKPGHAYTGPDIQAVSEPFATLNNSSNAKTSDAYGLDWNTFIAHGFNNTTPPTPEAFSQTQQQPTVSEAAVSYEPLDEPEEEGEILVGMGLYDTPDKLAEDPQLNNYRTTVSSLLGSSYRPHEPQGKGLKLEETWEPPKAEDETEEDGEEEEDDEDDSE